MRNAPLSVVAYEDRLVVPTLAITTAGYYLQVSPVWHASYAVDSLALALINAFEYGQPLVPALTREEFNSREDPVLRALRVPSWLKLAKQGASYGITWYPDKVTVTPSKLDKKGRFVDDLEQVTNLSAQSSFEDVARIIIGDLERVMHFDR